MKKAALFTILGLSAGLVVGCLDDSITGSRPLTFQLTSDLTEAIVGQTITFNYETTGTAIQGIILEYGDGVVDTSFVGGSAVQASGYLEHAYDVIGTFVVEGRVETATGNLS
jgi:hypothetical protein